MRWRFSQVAYALVSSAAIASAQEGTVELRIRLQSASNTPLAGALVGLLDARDSVVAEGLSSEDGRRVLRAVAGIYRIRVRRIGFRPFISEPMMIRRGEEVTLQIETPRVVLATVVITGRSQCRRIGGDAETLATVWDEVTKALRASQLTTEDLSGIGAARRYRREVTLDGAVVSSDTSVFSVINRRPFGAVDPAVLARLGYIQGDATSGWEYFGADETVLLSNAFSATHCFRLVRDRARSGQIGVAFDPVPRRRVPDISGTLWLDEATAELREIRFRFVTSGLLRRFEAGGFTRFRRMRSGAWIVDEWQLRLPRLGTSSGFTGSVTVIGYVEHGGGIVTGARSERIPGPTTTVTGVAYDSLARRPLRAATISLNGAAVATDDSGRFTFTSVPRGPQIVSFSHPVLSTLGFTALEREVSVAGDTTDIRLAVPSLEGVWRRLCADSAPSSDRRGILHGIVTDEGGSPLSGATVRVFWTELRLQTGAATAPAQLQMEMTTDNAGRYVACGFSSLVRGTAIAAAGGRSSVRRDFGFDGIPVIRRDLQLALSGPLTDSRREVVVIVTDATTGAPLADATVFVEGTTETARSDDMGRAVLRVTDRQPTVVIRRIGFAEQTLRLTLGTGRRQQLRAGLSAIRTLPSVAVTAAPSLPRAIERRRSLGSGWFYGAEEIARVDNMRSILARTPGAATEGTGRWAVRFRHPAQGGDCWADLYIDGRLSAPNVPSFGGRGVGIQKIEELDSYPPSSIAVIEVYPRASQAPQDIVQLRDGCGAILVWTTAYVERELDREERVQRSTAADTLRREP